ncbi:response regulator [Dendrosporobacter sp. 1207_IL3150]|uniref:response regulator n=1 Tax=Dendrosporobacter sp. 1207_IL3150 TaxID=3084054 RepID=UPI002FDB0067
MKRVLIVDDAAFIRLALRNMLEKNGFDVVAEAENGAIAIQKFKEYQPDLVTMDITMPEVDGIGALKAIKTIDRNAKVVMVSAMGQESHVKEAVINGASYFLVKPFKEEQVISTLTKILG